MNSMKTVFLAMAMAFAPMAMAQTTAPAQAPTTASATAPLGEGDRAVAASAAKIAPVAPDATIGQPVPKGYELQPQVTPVGRQARFMHDWVLMPIITGISIFVLLLMIWASWRYRAKANPVPSKVSHNTTIEVVWTLVPVGILLVIALFSFDLLHAQSKAPGKNAITIKAVGNQWYWSYEYPDNGGFEVTSNMLPDAEAKRRGEPRLLAVDNRMVVPVGVPIRLQTTSNDVIHGWMVPAFWAHIDAVPGRINETQFTVEKPGVYYGQCMNICGARHAFMPIVVEAMPMAQYNAWVASKGGATKGAAPAAAAAATTPPAATPAAPVSSPKA
ncbi:MAG: cytochrome c oxidase subunit II [Novosphingobium sp.]